MKKTAEQFLNPSRITEELVDRLKGLAISRVDVEAVMTTQRKNIEALADASRKTLDGARAVGKRQAEILQQAMSETAHSLEAATKAGPPADIAATRAELMKQGFEKALRSMRELAEMVSKAQHGALDTVSRRAVESLDEIRHMAMNTTAASTPKAPSAEATNRTHF
jgi:phasin family protein